MPTDSFPSTGPFLVSRAMRSKVSWSWSAEQSWYLQAKIHSLERKKSSTPSEGNIPSSYSCFFFKPPQFKIGNSSSLIFLGVKIYHIWNHHLIMYDTSVLIPSPPFYLKCFIFPRSAISKTTQLLTSSIAFQLVHELFRFSPLRGERQIYLSFYPNQWILVDI